MKSIVDFINESLVNEKYDKEIFKQLYNAINREREHYFYSVSFEDPEGNCGYMILERTSKNINKYLEKSGDFILHFEELSYHDIQNSMYYCEAMPSTFYCCGITLKDDDSTKGYLFLNIEERDRPTFEKWLNKQVAMVDVM